MIDKRFDDAHLDHSEYQYRVGRIGASGMLYPARSGGGRSADKTWKTLRGATQFAESLNLGPSEAIVVVLEGAWMRPRLKVIQAAAHSQLKPGDAFVRDPWKFRPMEGGGWDIF